MCVVVTFSSIVYIVHNYSCIVIQCIVVSSFYIHIPAGMAQCSGAVVESTASVHQ